MFDKIKRLGSDTAIYGVSTVVGRFLTFILTPFYTHLLLREELGIVGTVYAYVAFLIIIYGHGMEAAYMRFIASQEIGSKKQNFSVPFLSVLVTSMLFTLLIVFSESRIAAAINIPLQYSSIIAYSAWILLLDALTIVPFASLRMERKAKIFSALRLWNIIVTVVCNLVFLLEFKWGVEGIFFSNIIGSASTLVLLSPTIFRNLTIKWNASLYKALLRFSLPSVPAYLASMMIQVIDRPILESLTDMATVGLYQANYRLGIFMMLLVSMFDFAWRPFFLLHAKEGDAKQIFARVMTYFFLLMMSCFLAISFFIEDIVTMPIIDGLSIFDSRYWSGLYIVPIVLLAYVFLGISNILVAGIYIEKQTTKLPVVTFVGAAINIVMNLLLIPQIGILGAAIATLASYAIMVVVLYAIVQKIYPVEYEYGRLAKIGGAAIVVYLCFYFVRLDSFEIVWKLGLLTLFACLMLFMKFFNSSELVVIKKIFSRSNRFDSTPPPTEL